ncbi:response regulator transcription factor [Streptacidiphilus sp. PB12-B1b]|uniref:response regulator transcription factor n=1 Tax=Streptacidiphilus sp. PB12-B1b TaxID=2705012 RepID=UPI0015FD0BBB|nr:response regulator transcription factor [Streptacidiphilus sp. PB12-B1b]QMU78760.1 response regulator transcription factor [Streptacidiphilus sp. PB12-B1b]
MRLLLVEDDDHVAAALVAVLTKHGFEVRHARTGNEALDALVPDGRGPYRVVLLDLGLPDRDGFEVCGQIRLRGGIPVIMVTARSDINSRIHGLNLGADDYVVKPYDMGELLARIHAVARRGTAPAAVADGPGAAGSRAERLLARCGLVLDTSARRATVRGREVALTRKEYDLLALLAQSPGVVIRREQIISEVWRSSWEGTARTLEVHVASLRHKLAVPALIETVRGIGYRLVVPEDPAATADPAATKAGPEQGAPAAGPADAG